MSGEKYGHRRVPMYPKDVELLVEIVSARIAEVQTRPTCAESTAELRRLNRLLARLT